MCLAGQRSQIHLSPLCNLIGIKIQTQGACWSLSRWRTSTGKSVLKKSKEKYVLTRHLFSYLIFKIVVSFRDNKSIIPAVRER